MTMDGDPLFQWRAAALVRRFASDSSGAMAAEYAVVVFIAVAIAIAVGLMGDSLAAIYQRVREIFLD